MDSFFSLFDPSDGNQNKQTKSKHRPAEQKQDQDTVKKKAEGTAKGRRRGRKAQGKSETLPEECSFLCEPEISTELLVKNSSYIESFLEAHDEDPNSDRRPRRRNSGRKSRRKKRVSPANDITPSTGWTENDNQSETNWNNQSHISKNCNESIGKNVNDLSNDTSKQSENREAFNIIEKLEKVRLHNDVYMAGDFNNDDLDIDSDDQMSYDDSDSDMDSVCEYGRLPPEPRLGNVEYKLQLVNPSDSRFQHLVTQLKWRLVSGGGSAVYVVGVRDCGALVGLSARALRGSLRTVRRMAGSLAAGVAHVTARRLAPHRAVAEIYIRKLADTQQSEELRVAVMGANEAGKSTLVGVLTQGELDNGRGSARLNMFRHLHEVKSGRTSSLSHEILGFDAQGNVVNYGCSELMTAERIGERSAKLISFLDLAGHSKYQRTTLHGLTGYSPHCAMLVMSATAGITRITEEHIGLLTALDLPFFAVVTKCDLLAARTVLHRLGQAIATCYKKPVLITDENQAISCAKAQKLKLDTLDCDDGDAKTDDEPVQEIIPVFPVSCVRGFGLSALHAFLLHLQPPTTRHRETDTVEFQIDEIFHVGDSAGPVVGGLLTKGQLCEGDSVICGPLNTGEFVEISVQTIYRNRVPCGVVRAGQSASLGLSHYPPNIRAGMVLLSIPEVDKTATRPKFGGCPPGKCNREFVSPITQTNLKANNRKNVRRKNKNLLQDIATVENCLTKEKDDIDNSNIYRSDSDGEKSKNIYKSDKNKNSVIKSDKSSDESDKNSDSSEKTSVSSDEDKVSDGVVIKSDDECRCCDGVLLEDPNDPRGCMFFQAYVQVLRHPTVIAPGFQCTVHVGNVRQTAVIEGIMSRNNELRAGECAPVVFQFARCPEYLGRGRRLLLTAGGGTRAIGRITQIFPHIP